ncbi:MAG TPA: carbonic anhydrase [Actinomycetota bacterium]
MTVASGEKSLALLKEGNARFASDDSRRPHLSEARRISLADGQEPFAVVFGCVDSRVPPEVVFDRGLGDLLVIRTAGQAIDAAAIGSIEFGAAELGIPLVTVLGHEKCGAVNATIEALDAAATPEGSIGAIVESIAPAVRRSSGEGEELLDHAVRANIVNVVARLRESPVLTELEDSGRLVIVGAHYALDTGVVDFT